MPVAPSCHSGCQAQVAVLARIGWGLEPAFGREQVDAAVAVDVARADAVSGRRGAEVVLLELVAFAVALLDDLVPDDHVDRVRQQVGHAVSREVDHPGRFDVARLIDLVIGPGRAGLSRVLDPAHALAEVGARHGVGMAVAVDVERQGREIVVVRAHPRHVADVKGLPVGSLVPGVAREDVELAVVVDVEDARGLELAPAVDRVLLPLRLVRPEGPGDEERQPTRRRG